MKNKCWRLMTAMVGALLVLSSTSYGGAHEGGDLDFVPLKPEDFQTMREAIQPLTLAEKELLDELNVAANKVKCPVLVVDKPGAHFKRGQYVQMCGPYSDESYRFEPFDLPSSPPPPTHAVEKMAHYAGKLVTMGGVAWVVSAAKVTEPPAHPLPGKGHALIIDIVDSDPDGVKEIWISSPKQQDEAGGGHHGGSAHARR